MKERAKTALDKNLVVNLSDVKVPLYSVAILSHGPGWIPSPRFDECQFRLDGYNAADKQCWKAVFKDCERSNDLPTQLLKKPLTSPCSNIQDSAIKSAKDDIVNLWRISTQKRLNLI